MINGQVTGLWKRTIKKDKVIVETDFFGSTQKTELDLIKKSNCTVRAFFGKEKNRNKSYDKLIWEKKTNIAI